jgi:DNA-directed RNA polymerase subunit N (RpoN/RPB10)
MRFLRLIRAVLREIFDEAAYERFCARESLIANKNSYRRFLRYNDQSKPPKIKCC